MSPKKQSGSQKRRTQKQRMQRQRQILVLGGGSAIVAAVVIVALIFWAGQSPISSVFVPTPTPGSAQTVDGVQCESTEQLVYHIHSHLAVYLDGQPETIPADIGVRADCIYWLHTHDTSGVIHVESPTQTQYTLGQFFDIWGQTLDAQDVGREHGNIIFYVNGQRYNGDPRQIVLDAHTLIQIDIGQDTPPQPFTFPAGD